jgi:hypothetical protein
VAAPTCVLYTGNNATSIDINDGTTHTILDGVDMGIEQKTWDEYRSYSGSVAQYNVSEANLIDVTIPILVQRDSVANLRTTLAAINTSIAGIIAGTTHLVYAGTTYHLASSNKVGWVEDSEFLLKFRTVIVLQLKRVP